MVADVEVDKVTDMVADMVADMEVDKVANKVANMEMDKVADIEVDKVADMVDYIEVQGSGICGTFSDPELTQNHFLRTRMLRFSQQKCCILTFCDNKFIS